MRSTLSALARHASACGWVLAALLGSQSAFAAAPIVASASASLSNLQLQFSDFRPDDGIAAGVSWVSRGAGSAGVYCCDTNPFTDINMYREMQFSGDKLINTVVNGVSLAGGVASARRTSDGAQTSLVIDAEHIGSIHFGKSDISSLSASATVNSGSFKLLLQPGTEIQLTGWTTFDASMDLMNMPFYGTSSDPFPTPEVLVKLEGRSELKAQAQAGSNSLAFLVQPTTFAGGSVYQYKSSGKITEGVGELHQTKSFTYVVRNNGDQAQVLELALSSSIDFSGNYSSVSSIPEPESIALVFAGLVGLAWVRRRQGRKPVNKSVALCLSAAALLPMAAHAVPTVSATGAIHVVDQLGETTGGFDIDPQAEVFSAHAQGDPVFVDGSYYQGLTQANASHGATGLSVGVSTYEWDDLVLNNPTPVVTSSVSLDWSDTIVNTGAQARSVSLDFSTPNVKTWSMGDVGSFFKLSIWIEGQSSPVWSTGVSRQFDAAQNRAVNVFSGQGMGLWDEGYVSGLPWAGQISLGSLAASDSFKVHFSVEMFATGRSANMYLSSSEPVLKLGVSPVPEPSTWAMGLAGLALMGVFARRRQAA